MFGRSGHRGAVVVLEPKGGSGPCALSNFADFFCVAVQLAIEIDGTSHDGRERRDRLRDTFFRKRGIVVLRFTNEDAMHRPEVVFERIRHVVQHISPLAKRGGPGG